MAGGLPAVAPGLEPRSGQGLEQESDSLKRNEVEEAVYVLSLQSCLTL